MNNEDILKKAIDKVTEDKQKENERRTIVVKPNVAEFLDMYQEKRGYKSKSETFNKAIEHLIQLLIEE